jgi:hypothetical protein
LARVAELQAKVAEALEVTRETMAEQLMADREYARMMGQASAAVAASMGMVKLFGLIADRSQTGNVHLNVRVPYAEMPAPIEDAEVWEATYGKAIRGEK